MKRLMVLTVLTILFTALASAGEFSPGDIIFRKPLNAVLFSHEVHVKKAELTCGVCHPDLFVPRKGVLESKPDFTMKALSEGRYCGVCHNSEVAFSSQSQCARCHIGVKGARRAEALGVENMKAFMPEGQIRLGNPPTEAVFLHKRHAALGCAECHAREFPFSARGLKITMDEISGGKFCGRCHNGRMAFSVEDCGRCHPEM